jgi:hypothetical protein
VWRLQCCIGVVDGVVSPFEASRVIVFVTSAPGAVSALAAAATLRCSLVILRHSLQCLRTRTFVRVLKVFVHPVPAHRYFRASPGDVDISTVSLLYQE